MKFLTKNQKAIIDLIATNHVQEAIELTLSLLSNPLTELYFDTILVSNEYHMVEQMSKTGQLSMEDEFVKRKKLATNLLFLIRSNSTDLN